MTEPFLISVTINVRGNKCAEYDVYDVSLDVVSAEAKATFPEATSVMLTVRFDKGSKQP